MTALPYVLEPQANKTLGLVVLQSDETLEQDARRIFGTDVNLHFTRIPSGLEVSRDSLAEMESHLPQAAGLFPRGVGFDAIGYGCTSGTAQIGIDRIAQLVRSATPAAHVTQPVSALLAACDTLNLRNLAIVSPYVEEVSSRLRLVLADNGIKTPIFGSFEEAEEQKVARIAPASTYEAALELARSGKADGVFLSCTNLRSLDIIEPLEAALGLPVLSSNQVLCWYMAQLAGVPLSTGGFGRLL